MSIFDKLYVNTETQLSTAVAVGGTGYVITANQVIAALTILLLVGQLGLLGIKYYRTFKEWRNKKNELKE